MFLITAIFMPKLLDLPNRMWFIFGKSLGSLISFVIMFLIYVLTIVPIGIFFKLLRRDILKTKYENNAKTYWVKREEIETSLKNQF